jgi:hypothetical protein
MSHHPLTGQCHCGAIRVLLDPGRPVAELPLRACGCGFCRRHGAATTSDPAAHLHVEAAPGALGRYQFASRSTDFLFCAECGVYVAAVMPTETGLIGVLNVRGVDLPGFEGRVPDPVTHPANETADARLARRKARWMPAVVVEAQPNA